MSDFRSVAGKIRLGILLPSGRIHMFLRNCCQVEPGTSALHTNIVRDWCILSSPECPPLLDSVDNSIPMLRPHLQSISLQSIPGSRPRSRYRLYLHTCLVCTFYIRVRLLPPRHSTRCLQHNPCSHLLHHCLECQDTFLPCNQRTRKLRMPTKTCLRCNLRKRSILELP